MINNKRLPLTKAFIAIGYASLTTLYLALSGCGAGSTSSTNSVSPGTDNTDKVASKDGAADIGITESGITESGITESGITESGITESGKPSTGTADKSDTGDDKVSSDEISSSEGDSQTLPQSGQLTAGDYDDQLNSEFYQDYLTSVLQTSSKQLPFADINQRIAIHIHDINGHPYPGAKLRIHGNDQNQDSLLRSPADGTIYLYPELDQLADTFTLTASNPGQDIVESTTVDLQALPQNRSITLTLTLEKTTAAQLDLMLVVDTTGSMSDELSYLQSELIAIINRVTDENPGIDVQVGLVVYRDIGDTYVTKAFDFTSPSELADTLQEQSSGGGGDYPEAIDQALVSALAQTWRDQSDKILLLVTDAPPHERNIEQTWQSALQARQEQIHIVPIGASGIDSEAEFILRAMAAVTHSRYIFLTDDAGIGNNHKEAEVQCYIVTRLDAMISRVISSLTLGARVEPTSEEVIRTVGDYNNGKCMQNTLTIDKPLEEIPQTEVTEVSSYFSPFQYGSTQQFYLFTEHNTVLHLHLPNDSETVAINGQLLVFDENALIDDVKFWISNQHSDALNINAAEPVSTTMLSSEQIVITEQDEIERIVFTDPDTNATLEEYTHVRVAFEIKNIDGAAPLKDGTYTGSANVYIDQAAIND